VNLRAQPGYFGDPAAPIFGWLHAAADAPVRDLGLVLCNPFGYEALCTHRLYRQLAEQCAAAGIPTLRFDYPGTGDSAGNGEQGDRLAAWLAGIDQACASLRQLTSVSRIALCGLRLGALLAVVAAGRNPEVMAVAAIAPLASGRGYLRELRALAQASAFERPAGAAPAAAGIEPAGFLLNEPTSAALATLDLAAPGTLRPMQVLLLDRDDLPGSTAVQRQLTAQGATVSASQFTGYAALMQDPHRALIPAGLPGSIATWLTGLSVPTASAVTSQQALLPRIPVGVNAQGSPGSAPVTDAQIMEWPVEIPGSAPLFGIVTRAVHPRVAGGAPCLLLISSGANHRVGPGRLYVDLARALAADGLTVLRLDLEGIGDSPPSPASEDTVVYMPAAVDNIRRAVAYAHSNLAASACYSAGICSGAYHSLKAAAQGVGLECVLPINPLVYFWKPGMSLDVPPHRATAEARRISRSALRLASWRKLLRGEVAIGNAWRVYTHRLGAIARYRTRAVLRALRLPLSEDLATELSTAVAQGSALHFIFADGEPGLPMLHEQAGRVVEQLQRRGKLAIAVIEGTDHTFTPRWSHARLFASVRSALGAGGPAP